MFNKSLLKRNDKKIKSMLKKKDGRIDCTDTLHVIFPQRFVDKGLATIDDTVEAIGVCLVMDTKFNYTVFKLPNLLSYEPQMIETIDIDGIEHVILECRAPNFISSTSVIDNADPVFILLDDWPVMGNYPFYIDKDEVLQIITKSSNTTSTNFGLMLNRISSLLAITSRDKDVTVQTRHTGKPTEKWVGLIDASSAYNNNLSRIIGSYLNLGITAAVLDDDPIMTELEATLRV